MFDVQGQNTKVLFEILKTFVESIVPFPSLNEV